MATYSVLNNKYGGHINTIKTNIYWYGDQTAAVVVPAIPADQIWEVRILFISCSIVGTGGESAIITLVAAHADGVDITLASQVGDGTSTTINTTPDILPMTEGDLIKADIVSSATATSDYIKFMAFISKYYI